MAAKCLPVVLVPKQAVIATVRNDVIDHGRGCAALANRMGDEKDGASLAPIMVVATCCRCWAVAVMASLAGAVDLYLASAALA
ncbi:hypothetical protein [Devosia sp. 2618]|uniref:hypothetical protein n=1 Tax=Devosia sp. 2618 TaxID=3156454 RepID=UPI003396B382